MSDLRDAINTRREATNQAMARLMEAIQTGDQSVIAEAQRAYIDANNAAWDTFIDGVKRGEFDSLAAERDSAVSIVADPDTETDAGVEPAQRALSAVSGAVASDVHPAVQAVLGVTPINFEGQVFTGEFSAGGHLGEWWGAPAPIARKQTVAAARAFADLIDCDCDPLGDDDPICLTRIAALKLRHAADEIAPKEPTHDLA